MKGGKRVGAGRKPGTPNAKTVARKAEIAAGGEMPLDYALRIMRDPTQPNERRDWACGAAMRFCHSPPMPGDSAANPVRMEIRWKAS